MTNWVCSGISKMLDFDRVFCSDMYIKSKKKKKKVIYCDLRQCNWVFDQCVKSLTKKKNMHINNKVKIATTSIIFFINSFITLPTRVIFNVILIFGLKFQSMNSKLCSIIRHFLIVVASEQSHRFNNSSFTHCVFSLVDHKHNHNINEHKI